MREIRYTLLDDEETPTAQDSYDTVSFDGDRSEYVIENLVIDDNGTPGNVNDDFARIVRVTHLVGGVVGADGVDVVHNAERLQFADQSVILNANMANNAPQNPPTIDDPTPAETSC